MIYDKDSMVVWDITKLNSYGDMNEFDVEFVDIGNDIAGKLFMIMDASVTIGEITEAVVDQYHQGDYKDLNSNLAKRLIDWHDKTRKLKSVKDIGTWIAKNTNTKKDQESINKAMYWFVAMQEAAMLVDSSTKDIARMLIDGVPPANENDKYVADWLYNQQEIFDDNDIVDLLKTHFGV